MQKFFAGTLAFPKKRKKFKVGHARNSCVPKAGRKFICGSREKFLRAQSNEKIPLSVTRETRSFSFTGELFQ